MEDFVRVKDIVLWENMEKLIYYDGSVASRIKLGMDENGLLKMLGILEGNLNAAALSTLQSADYVDKELEQKVKHVLSSLESFVQVDQIKGKAKVFEEENDENPENIVLERFFKLLEKEIPIAKGQALPMEKDEQMGLTMFKQMAFTNEEKEFSNNKILLEIATKLYAQYHNDPPLLENVAALFSSKHTVKEWEDRCDTVLTSMRDASKTNLFNLKLSSYEQLQPDIQKCARYCSLFPKDYTFNKTDLIHLWASQEQLLNTAPNPELVGGEYFGKLLEKGYFFEIVQREGTGDKVGYKMHYLVNEFLKEIAKPEFCLVDDESPRENDVANILHLSVIVDSSWKPPSWMLTAKKFRSLLFLPRQICEDFVEVSDMDKILTSCTCLQALDLVAVNCDENILSSLGGLKELRYLRLGISLGKLPESIIRLENLQTLDLRLSSVMELPRNFHTFKHLRHLYVGSTLIEMPDQVSKLESLILLDLFVVGENNNLDALRSLKLDGELTVRFDKECDDVEALKDKILISDLSLIWSASHGGQTSVDDRLHFLQPPPNLKSLVVRSWKWGRFGNFSILENLVSLCIEDCSSCKYLPHLSSLRNLRSLQLSDLKSLEYIDNSDYSSQDSYSYFPSLKYVMLANLQELKGWSSRNKEEEIRSNSFHLRIKDCPKMMSIPRILNLESLDTHNIHEKLLKFLLTTSLDAQNSCINWWRRVPIPQFKAQESTYSGWFWLEPSSSSLQPSITSRLQNLEIVSIIDLDSTLTVSSIMKSLTIKRCSKLKKLDFKPDMNLLQQLVIHDCNGLQDITSALQLSSLKKLEIKHCEKLNLGDDSMRVAWEGLKSLQNLNLIGISNLASLENSLISLNKLEVLSLNSFYEVKALPEWIGKLTRLHRLSIQNCPYLITLPESLGDLSALQRLEIRCCPLLKPFPHSLGRMESLKQLKVQQCPKLFKRWRTDGEDSSLMQKVPYLIFKD